MNEQDHKAECLARWYQKRAKALELRKGLKDKVVRRSEIEQWLSEQSELDQRALRKVMNDAGGRS